jgi:hypothetical protein
MSAFTKSRWTESQPRPGAKDVIVNFAEDGTAVVQKDPWALSLMRRDRQRALGIEPGHGRFVCT